VVGVVCGFAANHPHHPTESCKTQCHSERSEESKNFNRTTVNFNKLDLLVIYNIYCGDAEKRFPKNKELR